MNAKDMHMSLKFISKINLILMKCMIIWCIL